MPTDDVVLSEEQCPPLANEGAFAALEDINDCLAVRLRLGINSSDLRDQFYFDTGSKRNLSDPKGATNVQSHISEYLSEKLRGAIRYQMLFGECGSAVHEHHQLHDALDLI